MRKLWLLITALAAVALSQTAPRNRVIGMVTETRADGLTLKTDAGEIFAVVFLPETKFRKVAPGEKDLAKAQAIKASEVESGDRVLARGTVVEEPKSVAAQWLIVMSYSDIAAKHERERAEWQRRGAAGSVVSMDPAAKEIKIRIPSFRGEQFITVALTDKTRLRRYAPDSVRFADAKPSTLAEVKAGDQLRALGEKSADGTRFTAEEVVTGSFRTVAATVTSVNPESGEIQIKDLDTAKPLSVKVTPDSVLRRFPEMAFGPVGQGGPGGGGRVAGGPGGGGPPGGMGRGMANMQEMFQRLPVTHLSDVKAGETIIVSSTRGANPQQLTAITLLTGAEGVVAMRRASLARASGGGGGSPSGPSMGTWNLGDMSSMIPMP